MPGYAAELPSTAGQPTDIPERFRPAPFRAAMEAEPPFGAPGRGARHYDRRSPGGKRVTDPEQTAGMARGKPFRPWLSAIQLGGPAATRPGPG